jgi:hypothetical protein
MNTHDYRKQVSLLLSLLPLVARENSFALHGGTAINLFHHKVEVNTIKRGCYSPPITKTLCENAQLAFNVFCEMQVVDNSHLFGGKICAALDRQHPRDLFDIQKMLKSQPFDNELKKGFIFYLVSSNRPVVELLFPNFINQNLAFDNQFSGMTFEPFSYEDFEATRIHLIQVIHTSLTIYDKIFLLSIENGTPDWKIYDFGIFPAIRWKLINVRLFKSQYPARHNQLYSELEAKLQSCH